MASRKPAAPKADQSTERKAFAFDAQIYLDAPAGGIVTDEGGRPVTDEGGRPLRKGA